MTPEGVALDNRRVSLAHLALALPWIAVVIDSFAEIRDNSFLWHVRAGELQTGAGRVLTADPFSYTMAESPWRTQSWLAELVYGVGERWADGLGFVPAMMLVAGTMLFVAIGLIVYRRSGSVATTALLLFFSVVLLVSFLAPRPVIFSFGLFALVILAWERPETRWALPFLFWIWASVHGSFVIGLGYLVLSALARRDYRGVWPVLPISALMTLLTAHGLGVVRMLLDFTSARGVLGLLSEWRPPDLASVPMWPFVIGMTVLVWGSYRRRIVTSDLWLIVPFLIFGLSATRAVPLAWLGLVPVMATGLGDLTVGSTPRLSRVPATLFVLVVAVLPFLIADDASIDRDRFPVEAASHLDEQRVFHDDRTGGYLIFAQWPQRRVYLDDRAELYQDRIREFVDIRNGVLDWRPIFERDRIQQALLRVEESLVDDLMAAGWRSVYRDDRYVVLTP